MFFDFTNSANMTKRKLVYWVGILIIVCLGFEGLPVCECVVDTPHDIERKLCPNQPAGTRDNTKVFASLGSRCSVENEAYVLGSLYYSFSKNYAGFTENNLRDRWKSLMYLNADGYDDLPPSQTKCIFNTRLAKQQSVITGTGLQVAVTCNPFHLVYCRTDYERTWSLKDYCDCHYLYTTKETTPTSSKCLGKAGVPCKFKQPASDSQKIPFEPNIMSIECGQGLTCKSADASVLSRVFKKSFSGIGMNPIVHDYVTSLATAYCSCPNSQGRDNIQNEMNDCRNSKYAKKSSAIRKCSHNTTNLIFTLLLFVFELYYTY